MNLLSRIFVGLFIATAAIASAQEIPELSNLEEWTTYYYLHPKPEEVARALKTIDSKGYFGNQDVQAPLSGFFAEIFRANPEQIEAWVTPYRGRPGLHILYSALWVADSSQSKAALKAFAEAATPDEAGMISSLLTSPPPNIESTDINSPAVLDYLWGRFMASGSEACVLRVIDQMKLANTKGNIGVMLIGGAAQWSIAANSRQHEKVQAIVKARAATADPTTRKMLKEILRKIEAEKKAHVR